MTAEGDKATKPDLAAALRQLVKAEGGQNLGPKAPPLVLAPALQVGGGLPNHPAAAAKAPPERIEEAVAAALRGPLGAEITDLIRKEIRAEIARALWAERMGRKAASD